MDNAIRILIVEDVATDAELAIRQLKREGLAVDAKRVDTEEALLAVLRNESPDVILSDYSLPGFNGLSALRIAKAEKPDIPFIFLSGTIGEETAIEALKSGAVDYVLKTNMNRLGPAVRRALDETRMRDAHQQAEARFRDLIEYAPHAVVVLDRSGRIQIFNAAAEILFGYSRSDAIGAESGMVIPGCFEDWHRRLSENFRKGAEAAASPQVTFETTARRKDGNEFPAEISLSPLQTNEGLWISGVVRDISVRKYHEERITRLSRIHTVLSGINTAIVRMRDRSRFLEEVCRIAMDDGLFAAAWIGILDHERGLLLPEAWAGVEREFLDELRISTDSSQPKGRGPGALSMILKSPMVVNDIYADPRLAPWRERLLARGYGSLCVMPLIVEGQAAGALILYARESDMFNEEELRLLATVAADISFALDHFGKEDRLNYLAYFDPVTGLPNRTLFQDRLGQLVAREGADSYREKIAVVLLGLDRFRIINETFGRAAADGVLREVAKRLRDCLPDPAYLARIHADYFAFVMKEVRSEGDVVALLERSVNPALAEHFPGIGEDVRVTATAGIVLYPTDGRDVDSLLRNAEAALKNAKVSKSSYLFYTAAMNARAAERLSIENRLRRALEEEQFVLHYQPKVDVDSGLIVGLEALIRWQEPNGNLVPPEKFIHVLEDTGLIVEVGNWVIKRAHRQYREWMAKGLATPRIAVNVSQLQIRQKDFVNHVLRTIEDIRAGEFELEITESLFMEGEDQDAARAKLGALRECGITMAIDDFGTGYSSLSYIAQLPIDTLKIDKSFIEDMASSEGHMAIVSTIISLAHSLKLKVVAEGVETQEQYDLLKKLHCDQIQGFVYSRSLSPEEVELKLMAA
ncbi:MAG: hypothetical protein K0S28_46 [Paucimonas sp.]|nr:hypothetical protein [Paucimonas sp.]